MSQRNPDCYFGIAGCSCRLSDYYKLKNKELSLAKIPTVNKLDKERKQLVNKVLSSYERLVPLCVYCGLSIPRGETYDPDYPLCEGCSVGVKDDLEEDENMSLLGSSSTEYHKIERVNGKVTSFTCGGKTVKNVTGTLNYCPYCGKSLSNLKPIKWENDVLSNWALQRSLQPLLDFLY
jgi:hypothetical protein